MSTKAGMGYFVASSGLKFFEVALRIYSKASLPFQTAETENLRALMNLRAIF